MSCVTKQITNQLGSIANECVEPPGSLPLAMDRVFFQLDRAEQFPGVMNKALDIILVPQAPDVVEPCLEVACHSLESHLCTQMETIAARLQNALDRCSEILDRVDLKK